MHDTANSCTMQSQSKIRLGRRRENSHFLFMDDLKLYGKKGNEIKGLVSILEVFFKTGMEFGIKKCSVIIMNREKVKSTGGI